MRPAQSSEQFALVALHAANGSLMLTVCEKDGFRELKRRLEGVPGPDEQTSQAQWVTMSLMRLRQLLIGIKQGITTPALSQKTQNLRQLGKAS